MPTYPADEREVIESPRTQGANEERIYSFDFTNCGVTTIEGTPTMQVMDGAADVTSDVMPGTASASGLVVTAPELKGLTAGHTYLVFARVGHDGGQKTELFCKVITKA